MKKYILKGTRVFEDKGTDYLILESDLSDNGDNLVTVFTDLDALLKLLENFDIHKDDYQRYKRNIISLTNRRPYDAWDYPDPECGIQYYKYITIYTLQD